MPNNPVTFPRRFFPARPAPQREIGAGLDLTLRLNKAAKAQQPCCEPEVSWVGELYDYSVPGNRPTYSDGNGNLVDWSLRPIHTLVMHVNDDISSGLYNIVGLFAAVTGACGNIEWTSNRIEVDAVNEYPMGAVYYMRIYQPVWSDNPSITLTASVDGVDLEPLVLTFELQPVPS